MKTIDAQPYFDPSAPVSDFGIRLGNHVIDVLRDTPTSEVVCVRFSGIRGAASSHFNILLYRLGKYAGVSAVESRLTFECASVPQREVFERSFQAVLAALREESAPQKVR